MIYISRYSNIFCIYYFIYMLYYRPIFCLHFFGSFQTLELLYQMANPQNRRVIVERLLHHLTSTTDVHIKVDVITKVTQLAEKFDEDRTWFIETVNRALVLGGEGAVPPGISHKVLAILPPGV